MIQTYWTIVSSWTFRSQVTEAFLWTVVAGVTWQAVPLGNGGLVAAKGTISRQDAPYRRSLYTTRTQKNKHCYTCSTFNDHLQINNTVFELKDKTSYLKILLVHWNVSITGSAAMRQNQVFNDSTKYWCDRNKKWKMAVKKKWYRYFGCIGCMHQVWSISYWVETDILFLVTVTLTLITDTWVAIPNCRLI